MPEPAPEQRVLRTPEQGIRLLSHCAPGVLERQYPEEYEHGNGEGGRRTG